MGVNPILDLLVYTCRQSQLFIRGEVEKSMGGGVGEGD